MKMFDSYNILEIIENHDIAENFFNSYFLCCLNEK